MKSNKRNSSVDLSNGRIAQLEVLVDEMIKDSPHENRIRGYMKAVGLAYDADPIVRMSSVLEALEGARREISHKDPVPDASI